MIGNKVGHSTGMLAVGSTPTLATDKEETIMCGGFIKLHRKITEWEWFYDNKTLVTFIHLLFMANWKDGKFQGVNVPRGSLITSVSHLAERTQQSIQQTRTALANLQSTNEITIKTTNRFSFITVNNYGLYQDYTQQDNKQNNKQDNKQITINQQTNNKQITTIEEYKNIRNKDIYICDSNEPPLTKVKKFQKPTIEEISAYCAERNNNVDSQKFFDYYEANGWKVGRNPMKDWKACVRTWERNNFGKGRYNGGSDPLDDLDLDSNPFEVSK